VTDQELTGPLATRGWMVHPADGRVVAFAGPYLHGAACAQRSLLCCQLGMGTSMCLRSVISHMR
jgi:hypothetical protein